MCIFILVYFYLFLFIFISIFILFLILFLFYFYFIFILSFIVYGAGVSRGAGARDRPVSPATGQAPQVPPGRLPQTRPALGMPAHGCRA